MKKSHPKSSPREFIRLDSVFPVEFQIFINEQPIDSSWHHCFTHNISKGGLCLEIMKMDEQTLKLFCGSSEIRLNLKIHIPIHHPPSHARGRVLWFKKSPGHPLSQYRVGLKFDLVEDRVVRKIVRFAYGRVILPKAALASIGILILGLAFSAYNNYKLNSYNKKLIEDMVTVLKDSQYNKDALRKIRQEKGFLDERLRQANSQIRAKEEELLRGENELKLIQEDNTEAIKGKESEIQKLEGMLGVLEQDKIGLMHKREDLNKREGEVEVKLKEIKEKKVVLEKANFEKMYQWVKMHQNPKSGLIASFEGDGELSGQAFTYDQALAVIVFSYFKDYNSAAKILDFYSTKSPKPPVFYNGYFSSGGEVSEFTIHSGPNLWLGIAALQYAALSKDNRYLPIARGIGDWMIKLQAEDPEGGLRGGPDIAWYSTEHNLDGFTFFDMLYKASAEPKYKQASRKILRWLKNNAFDSPAVPVKRGKGDATIATDTYAWSIASLGPERLKDMQMDAQEIMRFAEEHCGVETYFQRPNGENIRVKGFDFAKDTHLARGGVISSEWTAQMVLSYKILSRYFASQADTEKEGVYNNKANEYLSELTKMIISSPSRTGQGQGCLPYASSDFVDTGHGWRTPKGKNTGSLSGTIYTIFAYYGFNPLELSSS